MQVDRRYLERPGNVCIDGQQDAEALARLRAFAEAATCNGNQCWMQLGHAGRQSSGKVNSIPVGPSAVPLNGFPKYAIGHPREITAEEIESVIERFGNAARVAKDTGFTGVQIHGAHGYLISSFMNPNANKRGDKYGGPLENRARVLLEVVRTVRRAVGKQFPLCVKLNTSDFQKGGFNADEAIKVAKWLEEEGVDCIELSGGNYEAPTICANEGLWKSMEKEGLAPVRASTLKREAYYLEYCQMIRKEVKVPLMLTGGFRTAACMGECVGEGHCDFIGLGRPLCQLPDGPNQLMSGELAELPSYEDHLQVGFGFMQWWCGQGSPHWLGGLIYMICIQSFYYVNEYRIADGEKTKTSHSQYSCFRAFIRNEVRRAAFSVHFCSASSCVQCC